jgi:nucleoside-diphosphate-sugar epimerase
MSISSVLVTGSGGTVGTALCESLLDQGYDVTGVDLVENRWSDRVDECTIIADIRNEELLAQLPDEVDLIVHLAANARVHRLVEQPSLAKQNFDTTFNIAEYARNVDADLVFSSSREVYGNKGKIVYDETDTYVDECESPYTASKIGGEALVKSYGKCYGIDTTILRFSNVYGKYDVSDRVVPLFIAQAEAGEDLTVFGENKVLDFTYLDDCVDGVMRVVNNFKKSSGTTFNIASGKGSSLLELANLIVDKTDANVEVHTEPNRTGEVGRYVADISKAEKLLGYEPNYSFEEGIEKTVDWYLSNPQLLEMIRQQ